MNSTAAVTTITGLSTRFRALAAAMILSAALGMMTGCATESPIASSGGVREPAVGSAFVYRTIWGGGAPPYPHYDTMIVTRTGLDFSGRKGVMEAKFGSGNDGIYRYFDYDADGSVSIARSYYNIYSPADTAGGLVWVTFATSGRSTSVSGSLFSFDGIERQPLVTVTPAGSESIAVGTAGVASYRFLVSTLTDQYGSIDPIQERYWLASSLGVFSKIENDSPTDPFTTVLVASDIR